MGEPKGSTAEAASTDLSKKKNESSVISSSSYPVPGMPNTSLSISEATPSSSTSNFQGYESHYDTVPTPDSAGSMSQSSAVAAPYQDVISSSDSLDTQTYYYDQQGGQEQQYEVSTSGQYVVSNCLLVRCLESQNRHQIYMYVCFIFTDMFTGLTCTCTCRLLAVI